MRAPLLGTLLLSSLVMCGDEELLTECAAYKAALLAYNECDPGATPPAVDGRYEAYDCADDLSAALLGEQRTLGECAEYLNKLHDDDCTVLLGDERHVCKRNTLVLRELPGEPSDEDDVGKACLTAQVPGGGFSAGESYIESAHAGCNTRTCLVRGLDGDPRPDCNPAGEVRCVGQEQARRYSYCTCSCQLEGMDAPTTGHSLCTCPDGFECAGLARTGYCVRAGDGQGP